MRIIKLLMGIGLQIIEMSGIEARRFAIGRFYATAIKLSSLGVVSTYYSRNFRKSCLDSYKVSLIFGFVFFMLTVFQLNRSITIKWECGKQSRTNLFYWGRNSGILPPRQSKVWEELQLCSALAILYLHYAGRK